VCLNSYHVTVQSCDGEWNTDQETLADSAKGSDPPPPSRRSRTRWLFVRHGRCSTNLYHHKAVFTG